MECYSDFYMFALAISMYILGVGTVPLIAYLNYKYGD